MDIDNKILEIMRQYAVEGLLISDGCNMRYLSGFTGANGYLFLTENRKVILTDFRYTIQAENESREYEVFEIDSSYEEAINLLIQEENIETLAFEGQNLSYYDYEELKNNLNVKRLVSMKDEVSQLRSIKEPWELERIAQAEKIGDYAFDKILGKIKPGMTELEVAALIEYYLKSNGAENLSFDTIVASGVNSAMPHAVPTSRKIQQGDFLTMDFGCVYQGYCSDMTRTIVVGKASVEQKNIYQLVLDAQMAALEFIKAGYTGCEIDNVARKRIYEAGYEGCFGHGLGHGVGLYIHENPRLSPKEQKIIQSNMVVTVEPGIYVEGFGGVRIEDLICVTEAGAVNYTNSPKNLIEL
ncbi:M24 family metallopeptidase [[Clostridium] polysaccharolyticum]|uniref:Xaa-Pro aminopeptidase n=1 Tax=[Clostridium] polysaccharolyticum TaxID=29364 RepID=A0A1H9ZYJ8_9FIRM|nr:aminopeptidase P family protein [[Clostridium] polysaccharolyticum]SES86897.1 Xaa-Pro aminopeptidase [[Clostridium] polysaccharolyticum]